MPAVDAVDPTVCRLRRGHVLPWQRCILPYSAPADSTLSAPDSANSRQNSYTAD